MSKQKKKEEKKKEKQTTTFKFRSTEADNVCGKSLLHHQDSIQSYLHPPKK